MNQVKWMAAPFNCMWSLSSAVLAENWVRHATSTWKTNVSAYSICLRPLSIYFIYSGAFLRSYNWIFDNFWLSCWRLHTIFIQTNIHTETDTESDSEKFYSGKRLLSLVFMLWHELILLGASDCLSTIGCACEPQSRRMELISTQRIRVTQR